jgi:acyl-CoA thioesterase-1
MSGSLSREALAASGITVILVLGDSFTAGLGIPPKAAFPAQLEAQLRAQGEAVRVVNSGVSGDTTGAGRARVDRALADEKPAFVILELGANDALRGIQPFEVHANLYEIITKIQASGASLLLTGMRAPPNWGEEYSAAFDRIFPDLARTSRVPLYPFFLQGVAQDPRLNQPDGLHPNERGVRVLADRIAPIVTQLIRGQSGGEIPVATVDGIMSMDDQDYRRYTSGIGNLPELSESYIFGSKIRRPSVDSQGHIHVSTGPAGITAPPSASSGQ